MKHRYLPTEVVPIYLLAFLHAFELLGWQELGQVTGAHSVTWIRSYDGCSSDLAAQRFLWFNPQRHHILEATLLQLKSRRKLHAVGPCIP